MNPIAPLIAAIVAMSFHLDPAIARLHVEAAQQAAIKYSIPTEVLLSIAFIESRYDASALGRTECKDIIDTSTCKRVRGSWTGTTPPKKAKTGWFCGPLQIGWTSHPITWKECQRMRTDLSYAYETGAQGLVTWMTEPHCVKLSPEEQLRCALAGHNAGNFGIAHYQRQPFPKWVLLTQARIQQYATQALNAPDPEI